jgi:hypothetical protein
VPFPNIICWGRLSQAESYLTITVTSQIQRLGFGVTLKEKEKLIKARLPLIQKHKHEDED